MNDKLRTALNVFLEDMQGESFFSAYPNTHVKLTSEEQERETLFRRIWRQGKMDKETGLMILEPGLRWSIVFRDKSYSYQNDNFVLNLHEMTPAGEVIIDSSVISRSELEDKLLLSESCRLSVFAMLPSFQKESATADRRVVNIRTVFNSLAKVPEKTEEFIPTVSDEEIHAFYQQAQKDPEKLLNLPAGLYWKVEESTGPSLYSSVRVTLLRAVQKKSWFNGYKLDYVQQVGSATFIRKNMWDGDMLTIKEAFLKALNSSNQQKDVPAIYAYVQG